MNIEAEVMSQVPTTGRCSFMPLPPVNTWCVGDFITPIGVSTSAALAIVSTGGANQLPAARFRAAATTTDIARVPFALPPNFARSSPFGASSRRRKIKLVLAARMTDLTGSATANADLNLTATATFTCPVINPDTGVQSAGSAFFASDAVVSARLGTTLGAAASTVGVADQAADVVTGVRLYVFELTTGLSEAELQSLSHFTLASLAIAPTEVVGTNLAVDVFGGWLLFDDHLSVPKFIRQLLGH